MAALYASGAGPTAGQERFEFLDVLRGVALAGIVLANMVPLSLYLYLSESERASLSTASTDQWFDFLELVLIESKFYTIFSVLFGIGFSILMMRAEAKGMVSRRFFLRRALFLYLIGLAHGVLFWHNDILQSYAICGVLLLPFARTTDRTILGAATVALLVPLVFITIGLPLNLLYAWTYESESRLHGVVSTDAIFPLSAGYACVLAWLWTGTAGTMLAQAFAPVGRMALTLLRRRPAGRGDSCGADEPIPEIVPNTQPAFAHPSGELRLGRLLSASPTSTLRRRLSRAKWRSREGGPQRRIRNETARSR